MIGKVYFSVNRIRMAWFQFLLFQYVNVGFCIDDKWSSLFIRHWTEQLLKVNFYSSSFSTAFEHTRETFRFISIFCPPKDWLNFIYSIVKWHQLLFSRLICIDVCHFTIWKWLKWIFYCWWLWSFELKVKIDKIYSEWERNEMFLD